MFAAGKGNQPAPFKESCLHMAFSSVRVLNTSTSGKLSKETPPLGPPTPDRASEKIALSTRRRAFGNYKGILLLYSMPLFSYQQVHLSFVRAVCTGCGGQCVFLFLKPVFVSRVIQKAPTQPGLWEASIAFVSQIMVPLGVLGGLPRCWPQRLFPLTGKQIYPGPPGSLL